MDLRSIKGSQECITLAECLSTEISRLRELVPQRAIFTAVYNRKLTKKIELLEDIRRELLQCARDAMEPSDDQTKV